jgi:hypothetical protein
MGKQWSWSFGSRKLIHHQRLVVSPRLLARHKAPTYTTTFAPCGHNLMTVMGSEGSTDHLAERVGRGEK